MDALGEPESLSSGHELRGFDCGEPALDSWLIKYALLNQKSGQTKTFVLCSMPGKKVVAFYSLVVGSVLREEALGTIARSAPRTQPIPVIILARLGVAKSHQAQGLGKALLKDALMRVLLISRQAGCRAMLVHAKNEHAAGFYRRTAGFEPSPLNPLHLMLTIQSIESAVGA